MADSTELAARLEILQDAMASGEFSVKHNGRAVTYRNLDEMLALEAKLIKEINGSAKPYKKSYRLCVDRGL